MKRARLAKAIAVVVLTIVCVFVLSLAAGAAWALNELHDGIDRSAHRELQRASGSAARTDSVVLVLGIDTRDRKRDRGRADSIMLVRTGREGRLSVLSVPRNLAVEAAPGQLDEASRPYFSGGPAAQIRAISTSLAMPIDHVVVVHFEGLVELVDAVGGITVTNAHPIVSTPFDGRRWRFGAGRQRLDGRRALAYARVRTNEMNDSESDSSRTGRQQEVLLALARQLAHPTSIGRVRRITASFGDAVASDLGFREIVSLAQVARGARWSTIVRCRLGGEFASYDQATGAYRGRRERMRELLERGQFRRAPAMSLIELLRPAPDNKAVVDMFLDRRKLNASVGGSATFPAGCATTDVSS